MLARISERLGARPKRLAVWALLLPSICSCTVATTRVDDRAGRPTVYEDPGSPGRLGGVGIESQDLIAMTDLMMRDMLATRVLGAAETPPNVIIDAAYFRNESSTRFNVNAITDRLRVGLNRAARGRMAFIARHYGGMVANERTLKRMGTVDEATQGTTKAQAGGDYRLGGRVTSIDAVQAGTGVASRYHQIIFEMVDLETAELVWSGIYDFKKTAQDDIIYR